MLKRLARTLPDWKGALLAFASAILLILSFPDFEYWFLAWFALVPLLWAVERNMASTLKCFLLGWLFGTVFFFGTCWWLTYAPIHYAAFPWALAYFLMICVAMIVGLFPAIFAAILSVLLRRFGSWGLLAAPFVWVFTEFLRYWLTGNDWNAIGYSQAFAPAGQGFAQIGGVLFVSFAYLVLNGTIYALFYTLFFERGRSLLVVSQIGSVAILIMILGAKEIMKLAAGGFESFTSAYIVSVQPNVPMRDLDSQKWSALRQRQVDLAEADIKKIDAQLDGAPRPPITVVLPESPMNFEYTDDREFRQFVHDFTTRNNVSLLFNSAEPDLGSTKYFNSAVMVGPNGDEVAEYDKIFLLPFGEAVPGIFEGVLPGFVGDFAYGRNYNLMPVGQAKVGIMICFESHFGQLSRHYAANGADAIIEMTNDGYLGPTPVLRQHLANAVFRAVETNRPVLRVTNVGITAYIDERGQIMDAAEPYTEATRVWSIAKSDGRQTIYVRFGDWFAWLCTIVTVALLTFSVRRRLSSADAG